MNSTVRVPSDAPKSLPSRRLASIVNTLAQACQRRDAELQQWETRQAAAAAPTLQNFGSELDLGLALDTDSSDSSANFEQLDSAVTDPETVSIVRHAPSMATNNSMYGDHVAHFEDDPKAMLADLDRTSKCVRNHARSGPNDFDDPVQMLEELERISFSPCIVRGAHETDPKAMLADLDREMRTPCYESAHRDAEAELEAMYTRLTAVTPLLDGSSHQDRQPSYNRLLDHATTGNSDAEQDITTGPIDPQLKSYTIALGLETTACTWETVMGWSTYLFSPRLEGHAAQQQKRDMVERAEQELQATIEDVLRLETGYRRAEETKAVPCRLIVSNIAADATEEELRVFFYKYKWDIREIRFLDERDPVKRTRQAHVDMYTRMSAVHASFMMGSIFGLSPIIKLALAREP